MEDLRAPTTNGGFRFNTAYFNPSMLMTILIGLVIIILLVMLFQSSSPNSSPGQTQNKDMIYTNPLNNAMRTNPFVNNVQPRTML
ncbi:ODV-E18 [Urbanus proteus nucleopolyhedrovirus]|uniref:ODV-E18 n=1 Tax=Urbanus proteus nucleopolyhedrovirus TaxID=1675866 RepID=A0A162GTM4_9ABAC|nr:ODV-E18 [Urbanus proteus nucleopolyhedrovirus]AKR17279.1 ODV-E18 [Urbanus proteus nucleopolyhedrovirus]